MKRISLFTLIICLAGCHVKNCWQTPVVTMKVTHIQPGPGCTEVYLQYGRGTWMGCVKNLPDSVKVGKLITVNTMGGDTAKCTFTRIK